MDTDCFTFVPGLHPSLLLRYPGVMLSLTAVVDLLKLLDLLYRRIVYYISTTSL